MIKFSLKCGHDHVFDAWFRDGGAYDDQASGGHIECPACGDRAIRKAPMAPSIARSRGSVPEPDNGNGQDMSANRQDAALESTGRSNVGGTVSTNGEGPVETRVDGDNAQLMASSDRVRELLHAVKRHVEKNCDYVGDRFADEARRIHYGEADRRGIYGEASAEDAQDLQEEGIEISQIPWPTRSDS